MSKIFEAMQQSTNEKLDQLHCDTHPEEHRKQLYIELEVLENQLYQIDITDPRWLAFNKIKTEKSTQLEKLNKYFYKNYLNKKHDHRCDCDQCLLQGEARFEHERGN